MGFIDEAHEDDWCNLLLINFIQVTEKQVGVKKCNINGYINN